MSFNILEIKLFSQRHLKTMCLAWTPGALKKLKKWKKWNETTDNWHGK